jgi:CRISPR-associated protein Cmr5
MAEQNSNLRKLEQGRAAHAWKCAVAARSNSGIKYDEYKAYAKSLPMLIKTGGLGATLAFIRSKARKKTGENTAYGQIYDDISGYLKAERTYLIDLRNEELVEKIIKLDSSEYRAVTIEVLSYMQWLRRFAEGLSKS